MDHLNVIQTTEDTVYPTDADSVMESEVEPGIGASSPANRQ